MRDPDDLFMALGRSAFRRRQRLGPRDRAYFAARGLSEILAHGRRFVEERLAPAAPLADGRQTPMRGHPVFVAQHATATCCRGCLQKWHHIARGRPLSAEEINYVLDVLQRWLEERAPPPPPERQAKLF
jgi:hypothetical protein